MGSTLTIKLVDLSNAVNALCGRNYTVPNNIHFDYECLASINFALTAQQLQSASISAPNISQIFDPIRKSPNLTVFADEIKNIQTSALGSAQDKINSASITFKTSVMPALDAVKTSINNTFAPVESSVSEQLKSVDSSVDSYYYTALGYIDQTFIYRVLALAIFGLPLVVTLLGIPAKAPHLIKGVNCCCVPYYLLLHILAIIFLILTYVLGDVCYLTFDSPNPIDAGPISMVQASLNTCYNNGNMLQLAEKLNLADPSMTNFTALAEKQLNGMNFSSINNFDVDSVINLNDSPTSKISKLTSVDLSTVDNSTLVDIKLKHVPNLKTNLTLLNSSLSILYNLTNDPNTAPIQTYNATLDFQLLLFLRANATNDFRAKMEAVFVRIGELIDSNGYLDQIADTSVIMTDQMLVVNNTAKGVIVIKINLRILPICFQHITTSLLRN